ncbi:MAG TPA: radical SAM family heme chaperone HemW [Steroidobacteraceae bacterium]|nr:radical SAM family heme chaperone HemW [Steroidobacteraceae bacterium]
MKSAPAVEDATGPAGAVVSDVLPPLSLYVHFPWCVSKCPYCDFNSHALRDALPEARYVEALLADLATQAPRVRGREIGSVFLGGGTPSLFSPDALAGLMRQLRTLLSFAPDVEVTLEANPATVERGRFAEYAAAGINRVSLGAQSFDGETLRVLGRIHKPQDVFRAAEELHAAGVSNFNLDLMFALPQQSVAGALADVVTALSLQPAHLSHYHLTLEPGTLFAAQPPPLPDDDLAWDMQAACHALLAARDFAQYEVSAFALPGRQCRHNLNYWRFGDYLGLGAGAHGKLTRLAGEAERAAGSPALVIERSVHLREPRRYFASAANGPEWRRVPAADLPFEFAMNQLRVNEAFDEATFSERTGLRPGHIAAPLADLQTRGLLERGDPLVGGVWHVTGRGRQLLNEVVQRFLG